MRSLFCSADIISEHFCPAVVISLLLQRTFLCIYHNLNLLHGNYSPNQTYSHDPLHMWQYPLHRHSYMVNTSDPHCTSTSHAGWAPQALLCLLYQFILNIVGISNILKKEISLVPYPFSTVLLSVNNPQFRHPLQNLIHSWIRFRQKILELESITPLQFCLHL